MRKNRIVLVACALAAFAILVTSCKKKEENTSLRATIATLIEDEEDARMYIDFAMHNNQYWNSTDKIMVYNLDFEDGTNSRVAEWSTDESAEGQVAAYFSGSSIGALKDGYYFFYPSCMALGDDLDVDNREYFTVTPNQHYTMVTDPVGLRTATIDPDAFAQACTSQTLDFHMQNIFGVARIYLRGTENKTVDHIVLTDNVFDLTGEMSLKLHKVVDTRLAGMIDAYFNHNDAFYAQEWADYVIGDLDYQSTPTGKTVTLDCSEYSYVLPDGSAETYFGVQLNEWDAKSFFFCLRPAALSQGFVFTVYFTDNTCVTIHDFENLGAEDNRAYCIRPGRIKAIRLQEPLFETSTMYNDWGTW